ncbi:DUF7553 family protein [Salinigranum sp. GCM10025319]|uniref:DUF7553 family protein n=1 Tax=Salinigranum sp. GCM10025319 TaxID=3252687 RepID=UPI00360F094A
MNKHFEDAWYYLGRAVDHLRIGVEEELAPLEAVLRERFGWEVEPEQTRLDRFRDELRNVEGVGDVRERIDEYRATRSAE